MPNTENRKNSNKKPTLQEHSQTVIIPQLTPEMLEQARRAAERGKTAEQIEQEALAAAQTQPTLSLIEMFCALGARAESGRKQAGSTYGRKAQNGPARQ